MRLFWGINRKNFLSFCYHFSHRVHSLLVIFSQRLLLARIRIAILAQIRAGVGLYFSLYA